MKSNTPTLQHSRVGAVLVIGGGIAGIQASLDLAESGQKVYLLESSPAIGGTMAQLDKTFPTNDCSMCILSPKIVECGRHLNIELITLAELQNVEGKAGRFEIRVRQKARYVDPEKCTGCGECLEACPTRFVPDFKTIHPPATVTQEERDFVDKLIQHHGRSEQSLIHVMQVVNKELRYLPKSIVYYLSDQFSAPGSVIYRIGTFYTAFPFVPRGKHTISVCTGTACHIKGASKLKDELRRELGVDVEDTTKDGLFTLETVRCLGCCSLAPVVKVDDTVYGNVKTADLSKILKDYRK